MSGADYILGLLAIVTGLAITDLVASLHGLLINRRHVKWDWLALLVAAFVLVLIVDSWRISYVAFQGSVKGPPIWIFLLILFQVIPIYLAARAAFPDRIKPEVHVDLATHYASVARYVWTAIAVSLSCFLTSQALAFVTQGRMHYPQQAIQAAALLGAVLVLIAWPQRSVHRLIVPGIVLFLCAAVLPARLLVV